MAAPPVYRPDISRVQRMAAPKRYVPNMPSPVQQKATPRSISAGNPIRPLNRAAQLKPMSAPANHGMPAPPPPALASRGVFAPIQSKMSQRPGSAQITSPASLAPPTPRSPQQSSGRVVQPSFAKYKLFLNEKGVLTDKRAKRLREGQEAILKTRAKLNAGAGNITEQVVKSSGVSFVTTNYVKKTAQDYTSKGINFLEAWAISARRGSAGNCDEFAAVTYFYLLEMNTGEPISVVGLPNVGHHFVMIGDVADPSGDDAVVVDPWPAKGYAVLYDHWQYEGQKMAVTLGPTTSTGQTPLKGARQTLNNAGHNKKSFVRGLNEEFDRFGSGKEVKKTIDTVNQGPDRYFWGNKHTLKDAYRKRLKQVFERKRTAVTNPLALNQDEFEAIYS